MDDKVLSVLLLVSKRYMTASHLHINVSPMFQYWRIVVLSDWFFLTFFNASEIAVANFFFRMFDTNTFLIVNSISNLPFK